MRNERPRTVSRHGYLHFDATFCVLADFKFQNAASKNNENSNGIHCECEESKLRFVESKLCHETLQRQQFYKSCIYQQPDTNTGPVAGVILCVKERRYPAMPGPRTSVSDSRSSG